MHELATAPAPLESLPPGHGGFIVVAFAHQVGWGNMLPSLVVAVLLGLLTNRVLLVDFPDLDAVLESPLKWNYGVYQSKLGVGLTRNVFNVDPGDVNFWMRTDIRAVATDKAVWHFMDGDYAMPMLQVF